MSNTRFCGSCFAGTPFTSIKPVSCAKCGRPFEAAFAVTLLPTSQTAAPGQVVSSFGRPAPVGRTFRTRRGREIPLSAPAYVNNGPDDLEEDGDEGEDRQVTRAEIIEEAQALAATLDGSDFGLSIGDASGMGASKSFKFESLPFVQEARQAGATPKKTARKVKKA